MSDEEESQLTDKEKIEIAKWFLLNSPVGEIQYVAKDVREVLKDERVYRIAAAEAFPLYNKSHKICLEFPERSGEVLVTSFNEIDKNEYFDPRTAQVAIVDHVKQGTVIQKGLGQHLVLVTRKRGHEICAFNAEMIKYVSEAYPKGGKDVEEPGSNFEFFVVISAARLSPQNFCNGSWQSIWNVEFKDDIQLVEVRGKLQEPTILKRESPVRCKARMQGFNNVSVSLTNIIRRHETEYLNSLGPSKEASGYAHIVPMA